MFYLALRGLIPASQPVIGASGSIYGLLGIVAVQFPKAEILLFFVWPIRIRTAAILLGCIAFMTLVERGHNFAGNACHLAGIIFGLWWAAEGEAWWENSEWVWSQRKPPGTA
jgi:membrane associated rhomboid family serine protease